MSYEYYNLCATGQSMFSLSLIVQLRVSVHFASNVGRRVHGN